MSGAHITVDVMPKMNSYLSANFREFDGFTVFSLAFDGEEVKVFLETEQVEEFKRILQGAIDAHEMGRIEKEGESLTEPSGLASV
jgi:hypothetical protein